MLPILSFFGSSFLISPVLFRFFPEGVKNSSRLRRGLLNENPKLYEIIAPGIMELNKSSGVGRQDSTTVEQVV